MNARWEATNNFRFLSLSSDFIRRGKHT
jgi:hypothetical protein